MRGEGDSALPEQNRHDTPNSALMIAFHFPPCQGSSGLQRTLAFARHLPASGWTPLILTAHTHAHAHMSAGQLTEIPPSLLVRRAFALDTARHLAVNGRYLGWMATPDRWITWALGAIPVGLRMIRRYRPKILWSTYPIATAHFVAYVLQRLTNIPWVADFRDPMTEGTFTSPERFPSDPRIWKANRWIERRTVAHCARAIFVSPGALRLYGDRYPDRLATRCRLIQNGYDESSFAIAEQRVSQLKKGRNGRITLLHSGALYSGTGDRHPGQFFSALSDLFQRRLISPETLQIVLRASGHEEDYRRLIRQYGIEKLVALEPLIPYHEALAEMLRVDGLLIFQGSNCNPNIPAKLYEYLRAGRPIFAMASHSGDTASVLSQLGVGMIVPLESKEQIASGLVEFLEQIRTGTAPTAGLERVTQFSREFGVQQLAAVFDDLTK